jgi:hypothetical protein
MATALVAQYQVVWLFVPLALTLYLHVESATKTMVDALQGYKPTQHTVVGLFVSPA